MTRGAGEKSAEEWLAGRTQKRGGGDAAESESGGMAVLLEKRETAAKQGGEGSNGKVAGEVDSGPPGGSHNHPSGGAHKSRRQHRRFPKAPRPPRFFPKFMDVEQASRIHGDVPLFPEEEVFLPGDQPYGANGGQATLFGVTLRSALQEVCPKNSFGSTTTKTSRKTTDEKQARSVRRAGSKERKERKEDSKSPSSTLGDNLSVDHRGSSREPRVPEPREEAGHSGEFPSSGSAADVWCRNVLLGCGVVVVVGLMILARPLVPCGGGSEPRHLAWLLNDTHIYETHHRGISSGDL